MARNPHVKANEVLGQTDGQWIALKNTITTYLQARPTQQTVPDGELRALDAALSNQGLWNQIRDELDLGS